MKSTLSILILFFVFTGPAFAQTPLPLRDPGLSLNTAVIAKLEKTVFKMDDKATDSFCSVTPVTRDGYLVTALHCVRSCLLAMNAGEQAVNGYLGLRDLFVVRDPGSKTVCDNLSIPALGIEGGIEVVSSGSALSLYDSRFLNNFSGLYEELRSKGWTAKANDYAVLKIRAATPLRCLKITTSTVEATQDIYSIGYPVASRAGDPIVLSASRGKRFARVQESETFKSQGSDDQRAWVQEQYGSPDVIFSNAANTFGQSGGPVIDAGGAIVGVTSGFATPAGDNRNDVRELTAPTVLSVLRGLPKNFAAFLMKANAECE